jgi:hypothetical protein
MEPRESDGITFTEMRDAGTKRGDEAGAFVSGNEWQRWLDRPVPIGGMQVRMADAAGLDLDEHLTGTRCRYGYSSIVSGCPNARTTAARIVVGIGASCDADVRASGMPAVSGPRVMFSH